MKKRIKKTRYWINVYGEMEGNCLEIGPYAYPSKDEADFHQSSGRKKVVSFTINDKDLTKQS